MPHARDLRGAVRRHGDWPGLPRGENSGSAGGPGWPRTGLQRGRFRGPQRTPAALRLPALFRCGAPQIQQLLRGQAQERASAATVSADGTRPPSRNASHTVVRPSPVRAAICILLSRLCASASDSSRRSSASAVPLGVWSSLTRSAPWRCPGCLLSPFRTWEAGFRSSLPGRPGRCRLHFRTVVSAAVTAAARVRMPANATAARARAAG